MRCSLATFLFSYAMYKPSASDLAAARSGASPTAGTRLGYSRLGYLYFTTGRLSSSPACDPFSENTFGQSDISRAGDGVAFYFAFSKAMAWLFVIASIFAIPQAVMNAGGALQGAWGLAALSQTMLGNLGAAGASGGGSSGAFTSATTAALAAVGSRRVPGLYAALDFCGILVISLGIFWMLRFTAVRERAAATDALGAEDYTIMVSGLKRGVLSACAAGDCSCGATPLHPEALVEHFERIARTFTADWRVARVAGSGRSEVYFAGAELRAASLFRKRAQLIATLHEKQADLAALEKRVGLDPVSRWTRKTPGFARIANELRELVGGRARATKVAADLEALRRTEEEEAHQEAERCRQVTSDEDLYGEYNDDDDDEDNNNDDANSVHTAELLDETEKRGLSRHRLDSANTIELLDDTEKRGSAATDALSPTSRMTAPELRRTRQKSERLMGVSSRSIGIVTIDKEIGSKEEEKESSSDSAAAAAAMAADSSMYDAAAVAAARAPLSTQLNSNNKSSKSRLFGDGRRQERIRLASSHAPAHLSAAAGEDNRNILQNVSATSRAYAGARYSDDESSGSLSTVGRRGDSTNDDDDDDDAAAESEGDNGEDSDTQYTDDSASRRESTIQPTAGQNTTWWPEWLGGGGNSNSGIGVGGGGGGGGGGVVVDDDDMTPSGRVQSGRSRPPSAYAGFGSSSSSGGGAAASFGEGPFSATVQSHIMRMRARARAAELERWGEEGGGGRGEGGGRKKGAGGGIFTQVAGSPYFVPSYREQVTIGRYTRKSSRTFCGLCGDRPPLDVLDIPLGSALSSKRSVAMASRIAWLRGRIDDLLWDIDVATRAATKYVPDADVLAEMGGDFARRAAAHAAMATSPGAMRDAQRLAEAAGFNQDTSSASKRDVAIEDPVVAFITFESAQTAKAMIRLYSLGKLEWCVRGGTATVGLPNPGGHPKWFAADVATANVASAVAKKVNGAVFAADNRRKKMSKGGDEDDDDDDDVEGGSGRGKDDGSGRKKLEIEAEEEEIHVPLSFWGLQLQVARAPPADTLIWENLHTGPTQKAALNCCVSLIAATLCIFSFALLYGSQVFQSTSSLLTSDNSTYCEVVANAPWVSYARVDTSIGVAAIAANTTVTGDQFYILTADAAVSAGFLRTPPTPSTNTTINTTTTTTDTINWWAEIVPTGFIAFNFSILNSSAIAAGVTLPPPASSFSLDTYKGVDCGVRAASNNEGQGTFLPWDQTVNISCGAFGSTWGNSSSPLNLTLYPALNLAISLNTPILFPVTDMSRACKCSLAFVRAPGSLVPTGLSLSSFSPSEIMTLAAHWAQPTAPGTTPLVLPDWVTCYPWVLAYVSYAALVCAAAVAAIFINAAMASLLNVLKQYEAHTTTDRARSAHLVRAVVLQCFNTALLVLLVSAYVPSLPLDSPGAKYSDFSNAWYTNKGPTLIIAVIAQGLCGPLLRLTSACCWRLRRHAMCTLLGCCQVSARGPGDLSVKLSPPIFDFSDRYAETVTLASVTLVYSTGIPLLIPLAALFITFGGAVDRALFLLHYAAPPIENASTGRLAVTLLPVALLFHSLVGAWMMSTPGLAAMATGQEADATVSLVAIAPTFESAAAFAQEVATRAAHVWVAPLLLEAAVWIVWILVAATFALCLGPLTSAVTGTWRACTCCRNSTVNRFDPPLPPPGAAEGPRALAATDISRIGDFAFLQPVLKWLPRVAAARDARGDAPPSVDALESALRAEAADDANSSSAAAAALVGASKESATNAVPPPLSPVGGKSETKAQRIARRTALVAAAASARAAAEDVAAERASRRAAFALCTMRSVMCICVAAKDAGRWCVYWFFQRPKVRAAAAQHAVALKKRAASAARRERKRARAASRAAKGKPPRTSSSSRKGKGMVESKAAGDSDDDDDGGKLPILVEDVPPPPCHVYCCGGRVRIGACCEQGCFGGLCPSAKAKAAAAEAHKVGTLNESARAALLPPPPFASALALRLLRGAVSYSPLASQPLLRSALPELWHTRAELPATHVTLARAAIFGYASLMPAPIGAPGLTGAVPEDAEPWEEEDDTMREGLPNNQRQQQKYSGGGRNNFQKRQTNESSDESSSSSYSSDSVDDSDDSVSRKRKKKGGAQARGRYIDQ